MPAGQVAAAAGTLELQDAWVDMDARRSFDEACDLGGVGDVRIIARPVFRDDVAAGAARGEKHEEAAVFGVVGVKGEAEKTLFAAAQQPFGEVEKGLGDQRTIFDDANEASLFHHEEPVVSRRTLQVDGGREGVIGNDVFRSKAWKAPGGAVFGAGIHTGIHTGVRFDAGVTLDRGVGLDRGIGWS